MKSNKKIIIILMTALMALSMLSGCTTRIGWVENSMPSYSKASYVSFDGTWDRGITAKEGQNIILDYTSEVKNGTLAITVMDPKGEEIAQLEPNTTGTQEIQVEKGGKYRIVLNGDKTKGSFRFDWKIE